MNTFRFPAVAFLTLVSLFTLAVSSATAGSTGNGWAQRLKLVVDSVDVTVGTVVLKSMVDQSSETFKVDAKTRISVGPKKGTIDQIKPGMQVVNCSPVFSPKAAGNQTLTMLVVWPTPAATAPAPASPSQ